MSDVTEQDEVLAKRFYDDTGFTAPAKDRPASHEQALRLALWRTWHILAKLREPSEAVVKAVKDAIYEELGIDYWDGKTRRILYYAVAAAEQEVSNDR